MAWLSDSQICIMYRDSANKKEQIKILSDLTLYSVERVAKILRENGYEPEMPKKYTSLYKRRWSIDEYLLVLRLYHSGASKKKIAQELDRSISSITMVLNALLGHPGYVTNRNMRTALNIYKTGRAL